MLIYTKLKLLKKGYTGDIESLIKEKSVEEVEKIVEQIPYEKNNRVEKQRFDTVAAFFRKYCIKYKCPRCFHKNAKFTKGSSLRILKVLPDKQIEYMSPEKIKEIIDALYENESPLLEEFFASSNSGMFFLEYLPVMANKFRPANFVKGSAVENPMNTLMIKIMHYSVLTENDSKYWPELQGFVATYFDSSKGTAAQNGHKQVLEKKDGLFRKNIMGKRVNYAARSVISPDPNLETREIGVPMVFATALTFPEKVTKFNVDKLRNMVINGPKYPGCNFIQNNDALTNIKYISEENRLTQANQLMDGSKIVWRHLQDGDPVLVNRQPTLHSVSLMAHTVKVLKNEKTLRLHYVNCKPYNADFDGDEMNIHFPQSFQSISEAQNLVLNDFNYFVPASGTPVRGLAQDHIVAAAVLTLKDSFFKKHEYYSLVHAGLTNLKNSSSYFKNNRYSFVEPCIISPIELYSGKQVITTIFKNFQITINHRFKCKMPFSTEENFAVFKNGTMITGILDKNSIGPTAESIVHACGEVYGYPLANDILTVLGRIVNNYLFMKGFTIRYDDLLTDKMADSKRHEIFYKANQDAISFQKHRCTESDAEYLSENEIDDSKVHPLFGTSDYYFDEDKLALLDGKMRGFMNNVTSKVVALLDDGLLKKFPSNNMSNAILSGSKGSIVNFSQISGALGQQELEGKRVPVMESGKTLPCFKKLEMCPAAGGFVAERFLTGITPATFFFHTMAGRDGLIDTAVKVSNSGYLQRCIIKHLEGAKVEYDHTVRANGRILQYKYGDDGLNCTKDSYIRNVDFYESNLHLVNDSTNTDFDGRLNIIPHEFLDHINECPDKLKNFLKNKYLNSLADPGYSAGIMAAQSIGEPSTQMTLNTFHLAGVGGNNVTLGIPRLREIIMVASKSIKTPIITVPLLYNSEENVNKIVDLFQRITLYECLDKVHVEEQILEKGIEFKKRVKIIFEVRDHLEASLKALDSTFLKALGKEIKKKTSAVGITEYSSKLVFHEKDSNEQSEESSDNDDDVDVEKDYENTKNVEDFKEDENQEGFLEDLHSEEDEKEEDESGGIPLINLRKMSSKKFYFEIFYPSDFNVLLLPLIESVSKNIIVREIGGFNKANNNCGKISLEGSNFLNLANKFTFVSTGNNQTIPNSKNHEEIDLMEILDFYNSQSNDIYAIYTAFGVEAARQVIVQEIRNVFDVYGININIRHLYLIADYMTKDGEYKSFSRSAFTMDDSFLQRMSFESCFTYLKNASIFHQSDDLQSPSSCLTVGNVIQNGTGTFDVLYNFDAAEE
jgi:DNA-directed RNA polymerase I subunit RPA1